MRGVLESIHHFTMENAQGGQRRKANNPIYQMGVFALCISFLLLTSFLAQLCVSDSDDRLLPGESLLPNQTLVSDGGRFALGFFPLGASPPRHYLGIWYNNLPNRTVVWVANRENPFMDSTVTLRMSNNSNLVVSNTVGGILWSSNISSANINPTRGSIAAVLQNTGNLVLRGAAEDDIRWQSFDVPGNTALPGMKLWFNKTTGLGNRYTSWKDADDPSPGDFSFGIDPITILQGMIWRKGQPYWRYNPWNANLMGGTTLLKNTYASSFSMERNNEGAFITLTSSSDLIQRFFLDQIGLLRFLYWDSSSNKWAELWSNADIKLCATYGACGPFGLCNETLATPACSCLDGYEPRVASEWKKGVFSGGCVLRSALRCDGRDEFRTVVSTKLPDKMVYLENVMSERDCEAACHSNCSCTAYAHAQVTNINMTINRCFVWYGELTDMVQYEPPKPAEDLHLRLPAAKQQKVGIKFIIILVAGVTFSVTLIYLMWRYKKIIKDLWKRIQREGVVDHKFDGEGKEGSVDMPLQSFEYIAAITNNFCDSNKLGEGGFGKVYKGILHSGVEIAIKRLSEGSRQGQEEFKNEVALIAKLQHKNLVRLLGSCIQGEERLLIYEYLPNGSLNSFLFDSTKQRMLDWGMRFNIIKGIARGMMYLHQDSRFKIVHRDLKAGNILLDENMNPKISDFGMARIFGGNESRVITNRVVGTYGYMSPEYAMEGLFSVKSDVYSFGVLLLEIISGRRNSSFYHNEVFLNLLTYAWQVWKEEKVMEFLDSSITETSSLTEVSRCVHVGLLCVQDHVNERPFMSSVVFLLENNTPILDTPNRPMFTIEGGLHGSGLPNKNIISPSVNDLSITVVEGR